MELSVDSDATKVIKFGICAMNKKTTSIAMREILSRLQQFECMEFTVFSEDTILNKPVEEWPIVDALVAFYSTGFPLEKAVAYNKLRQPFVLNDLEIQDCLQDRREVYKLLDSCGIETPRHVIFNRDANNNPVSSNEIIENDDTIVVNGVNFTKPFVEKPVNAEDHNIFIYYPSYDGGGCQVLFRKIGNKSSLYTSQSHIRRKGSFIYEDFMPTAGTDVKVYTVGAEYAYAEARKSPALDGNVEREEDGKEVRYPVILSTFEKLIAQKVCKAFKQTVCGFDLLRANGKSLVCDVNGFSFVKSQKYYDDCSQLLAEIVLKNLSTRHFDTGLRDRMAPPAVNGSQTQLSSRMELRSLILVMRHGDRTPKQKMKIIVTHRLFQEIFTKYGGQEDGRIKLKMPTHLQEMLNVCKQLINGYNDERLQPISEDLNTMKRMKIVLEMYGHFDGINRKIQMKSMSDERNKGMFSKLSGRNEMHLLGCEGRTFPPLLLILKWGGELTPMGRKQAEDLGRSFRGLYPGEGGILPGGGLLRLHSTYRHDLKIYSSDEGRVKMTAAAFAKGLLDLEGELTPILVSLVKNDKYVAGMLEMPVNSSGNLLKVKGRLHDIMHLNREFTEEDIRKLAPSGMTSIEKAMRFVGNPRKMCNKVYEMVCDLTEQIIELCEQARSRRCYYEERLDLMKHRWMKLKKDFKNGDDIFDISLIPDIYDCVKYDYLHNASLGLEKLPELYKNTKTLADIVIPQEYGITGEEKKTISKEICSDFLKKIQADLNVHQNESYNKLDASASQGIASPNIHVRTRLYITSESHVHAVINAMKEGELFKDRMDSDSVAALNILRETSELNYLTQIVIMQYENMAASPVSKDRFRLEVSFSAGVKCPTTDSVAKQLQDESISNNEDYVIKKNFDEDSAALFERTQDAEILAEIERRAKANNVASIRRGGSISSDEMAVAINTSTSRRKVSYLSRLKSFSVTEDSALVGKSIPAHTTIETLPSLYPLKMLHGSLQLSDMNRFFHDIVGHSKSKRALKKSSLDHDAESLRRL